MQNAQELADRPQGFRAQVRASLLGLVPVAELVGAQSPMWMVATLAAVYGNHAAWLSALPGMAIAAATLAATFAAGWLNVKRVNQGFLIMAACFVGMAFEPPVAVAGLLLGVAGGAALMMPYVRIAAPAITGVKAIAINARISMITGVAQPLVIPAVAWAGMSLGLGGACLAIAGAMVASWAIGQYLLKGYEPPAVRTENLAARLKLAWTWDAIRRTMINALNAAMIGALLGPLPLILINHGLGGAGWLGGLAAAGMLGSVLVGFVWPRIIANRRAHGLVLAAVLTLIGSLLLWIAEVTLDDRRWWYACMCVMVTLSSMAVNGFEASLYAEHGDRPQAQATLFNVGRAAGFSVGGMLGTWTALTVVVIFGGLSVSYAVVALVVALIAVPATRYVVTRGDRERGPAGQ